MNIFPSTPEIILAIFTTLLSLAVALFLLKIQIADSRSVKSLEKEQKFLIAKQSETNDLIRSKLVTSQETQEAMDFLDRDASTYINEVDEKLKVLEGQKKKISIMTFLGIVLMLFSLGANAYLSRLTVVVFVNILFFAFMWYLGILLKNYNKNVAIVRKKHDYLSSEILRAIDLVRKSLKR